MEEEEDNNQDNKKYFFNQKKYGWNMALQIAETIQALSNDCNFLRLEVKENPYLIEKYKTALESYFGKIRPFLLGQKIPDKVIKRTESVGLFGSKQFLYWDHFLNMFNEANKLIHDIKDESEFGFDPNYLRDKLVKILNKIDDDLELAKEEKIGIPGESTSGDPLSHLKGRFKRRSN